MSDDSDEQHRQKMIRRKEAHDRKLGSTRSGPGSSPRRRLSSNLSNC
jgi:hypothetical protein